LEYPKEIVEEGEARVMVPCLLPGKGEPLERARSHTPVFYNPVMRLNRDSSVLCLSVNTRRLSRPVVACEPMCGSGVRGVRLALEVEGVDSVILGDLNPRAVELAEENARLNGVHDRVSVRLMEANMLLALRDRPRRRLDYIDIDPYGTPAPYLDSAVRASRRDGMIALTATDMPPLCGVNPRACLRNYGGRPLRTEYCHEVALRLVAGALVRAAVRHENAARPVFSYSTDHYVRLYASIRGGARRADRCLEEMGYLLHCFRCSHRRTVGLDLKGQLDCEVCGARMSVGGPLWLGDLADSSFCGEMLEASERSVVGSNRRLMEMVRLVRGEVGQPVGFHRIDKLCSRIGVASMPTEKALDAIRDAGHRAVRTHFDRRGVKTDASITELLEALRCAKEAG
jgi:tRNA (guanine26-N2/guanine27-N2)-dimethyltransferase